jgi:hypothetical protein
VQLYVFEVVAEDVIKREGIVNILPSLGFFFLLLLLFGWLVFAFLYCACFLGP